MVKFFFYDFLYSILPKTLSTPYSKGIYREVKCINTLLVKLIATLDVYLDYQIKETVVKSMGIKIRIETYLLISLVHIIKLTYIIK